MCVIALANWCDACVRFFFFFFSPPLHAYRLCSLGSCTTDSSQVLKGCHRHPREVGGIEGFDWLSAMIILNTYWLVEALVMIVSGPTPWRLALR